MADTRDKLILDLRKDREFQLGTIPGAVHIYWEDLQNQMQELPKDKPIYMMCYTGETSDEFAQWMQEHGWEAYSIEDGLPRILSLADYTGITDRKAFRREGFFYIYRDNRHEILIPKLPEIRYTKSIYARICAQRLANGRKMLYNRKKFVTM